MRVAKGAVRVKTKVTGTVVFGVNEKVE